MRDSDVCCATSHADLRLAQRNLSPSDVAYVYRYGRTHRAANALFIHLGRRDIPGDDRKVSQRQRLEGTVLVLDPETGTVLVTAYRNRQHGIRHIKSKLKRGSVLTFKAG